MNPVKKRSSTSLVLILVLMLLIALGASGILLLAIDQNSKQAAFTGTAAAIYGTNTQIASYNLQTETASAWTNTPTYTSTPTDTATRTMTETPDFPMTDMAGTQTAIALMSTGGSIDTSGTTVARTQTAQVLSLTQTSLAGIFTPPTPIETGDPVLIAAATLASQQTATANANTVSAALTEGAVTVRPLGHTSTPTETITPTATPTRTNTALRTATQTPSPFTPDVPATRTAAAFKTSDALNLTPVATQLTPSTKVVENPNTDPDDLGMANARLRAPHEMAVGEVAVIKLEIAVQPLSETPTYIPSRAPTSTLAPNQTVPPASTELPLIVSVDVPARTFMRARLSGLDFSKFEIVSQEPPAQELGKRVLLRGQTAWWEWNIQAKDASVVGIRQLQIIISYEQLENGQIREITQPPLQFQITVNAAAATLKSEPSASTLTNFLPVGVGFTLAIVLLITVVVSLRRKSASVRGSDTNIGSLPAIPLMKTTQLNQVLCFVSYSRKDEDFTIKLAQRLRLEGIKVWRDRDDIPTGASWDDEIDKALKRCTHVLFVASKTSVASKNVLDELNAALSYDKFVLPVLVEDCEIPFRLRRNQWVDFRGDFETAIAKLLKDLGKDAK